MVTALGGVIIGIGGLIVSRRKSRLDSDKPSIHQEVVRPETAAEIRSAKALEDIASSMAKVERNIDVFMDRRPRE